MTAKEAYDLTFIAIRKGQLLTEMESYEYWAKVLRALRMQVPKEPNDGKCPICGESACDDYCRYCGQRLEWE